MHFIFSVVAAKNYGRKNQHDIRSDAWGHASGHLIFYGHEPRLGRCWCWNSNNCV